MTIAADPSITSARVMHGETARPGDRVKHYGQRFPGAYTGTATVTGFVRADATANPLGFRDDWIKVLVDPDRGDNDPYGRAWDWDRVELIDADERTAS